MNKTFFQKNFKKIILAVLLVAAAVYGISRLNIQSVSDYEKESNDLQSELQMEVVSGSASEASEERQMPGDVEESVRGSELAGSTDAAGSPDVKVDDPEKVSTSRPANIDGKETSDPEATAGGKKKSAARETDKTTKKTAGPAGSTSKKDSGSPDQKKKTDTKKDPAPAATKASNSGSDGKITCTIEIRCDALSRRRDSLSEELKDLVPENGVVLAKTRVTVKKGTSVYKVLADVCKASKIQIDAEYTPMYGTYYVKGIAHLYEMDAGNMSGWLYFVNDVKPDVGSSDYKVADGDAIRWSYTCDGETAQ